MAADREQNREIVLPPGTYGYMQDETRGQIKTHVGPCVINQTGQDTPVRYDPNTETFTQCTLEQAVQKCPRASEGDYIVLENPGRDSDGAHGIHAHPNEGVNSAASLHIGRRKNIPGPCQFALWPMQKARVIQGHRLRSNQYLVVRVYNEDEATINWHSTVARRADGDSDEASDVITETVDLTIGKQLVIKGTEISFYIPPTGVEVVPDEESGQYIRNAVSLERLEYCILVDEDGNKRYERGPQVVFPQPTEQFFTKNGNRKFKAFELNQIQGIHLKVIEDYLENERQYKAGDEIFITGDDCPIYFPRAQHSIITYGDKEKHYATAIPAGEGRYQMNRRTGQIDTIQGPQMLLPNPVDSVIVRRVLSDRQCRLWYPGNNEALSYNQSLRSLANESGSKGQFVSEGEVTNIRNRKDRKSLAQYSNVSNSSFSATEGYESDMEALIGGMGPEAAGSPAMNDTFSRGTQYSPPRMVTLDTKYEGVPAIGVWTGYAVMVVNKTGQRRVVKGPDTVLLDYDETLEVLTLSTGKPKNTDKLEETVYLRIANNKVSDIINVKTKDHVDVNIKVSYRVNFTGDEPEKWFQVENYVKFLCDHARSIMKGVAQKTKVEDFYQDGVKIIRDSILGDTNEDGKRFGMLFEENNMHVLDVEVLDISVQDEDVAALLANAQLKIVQSNIELHEAEKDLEVTKRMELISKEKAEAANATKERIAELDRQLVAIRAETEKAKIGTEIEVADQNKLKELALQAIKDVAAERQLARDKAEQDQELLHQKAADDLEIEKQRALAEALVRRFEAVQPGLTEALLQLQSQETLVKISQALSAQKLIGGENLVDILQQFFQGSSVESMMSKITDRISIPSLRDE